MKMALTTREAAELLGVAPGTLRSWRSRGKGPAYRQPAGHGSQPYYMREEIERFRATKLCEWLSKD